MWLSSHQRREAKSRAPDYARYYTLRFGDGAPAELERRMRRTGTSRYYRYLFRLALVHLRGRG